MKVNKGEAAFDAWYRDRFGSRWNSLRSALTDESERRHVQIESGDGSAYHIDPASVLAARLLPLGDAREVVDLCAAPGGKALVLARALAPSATFIANERSDARRRRLLTVLDGWLDGATRARVHVTGHDATRWGLVRPRSADAVLADVPCSSERHVLGDAAELARWTSARVRRLVATQRAILAAAVDATRAGGSVLYATCALSSEENDGVVARILERREKVEAITITAAELATAAHDLIDATRIERTAHGIHVLPDVLTGSGPIYAALLRVTA